MATLMSTRIFTMLMDKFQNYDERGYGPRFGFAKHLVILTRFHILRKVAIWDPSTSSYINQTKSCDDYFVSIAKKVMM